MRSFLKKFEALSYLIERNSIPIIFSIFFIIFLIISLNILNYGVSQDEYFSRTFGFINLNYIGNLIFPDLVNNIKNDKVIPELKNFEHNFYTGALFESVISATEVFFNIKEKKISVSAKTCFYFKFFLY